MSAQPTEQERQEQPQRGCEACGQVVENEEIVEQPDGSWKHPGCAADENDEGDGPVLVQPSEAAAVEQGKAIEPHSKRGSLSLAPDQVHLTAVQKAALIAINIDVNGDPGVQPQIRPFMHMCQVRGLDPFAREAYLIGRGKGNNRKWTMQTGIDGYRKLAAATKRFIRVKKRLWTGSEDDPNWYRMVEDEDGDLIKQRVWTDAWLEAEHPAAAKVVIEHYDERGERTTTSAVGNWEMFAPYNDVWEGPKGSRKQKYNADGTPAKELTGMWVKGGPHMLSKCVEALCYRMAFPNQMHGFYIHEEMHRLDAQERNRVTAEQSAPRRASVMQNGAHQITTSAPVRSVVVPQGDADDDTVSAPDLPGFEPVQAGEVARDVVDALQQQDQGAPENAPQDAPQGAPSTAPSDRDDAPSDAPQMTEGERLSAVRGELEWQAEQLGKTTNWLAQRRIRALRKNLDQFTVDELLVIALSWREMAGHKLAQEDPQAAARYASAGRDIVSMDWVLGVVEGEVVEDGGDPVDDPRLDANPEELHEYVNQGGTCGVCGRFQDEPIHS